VFSHEQPCLSHPIPFFLHLNREFVPLLLQSYHGSDCRPPYKATSSPSPAPAPSQSPSYFEIVISNLLKLGALTLEDFLRDPYQNLRHRKISSPTHSTTMCPSYRLSSPIKVQRVVNSRRRLPRYSFWTRSARKHLEVLMPSITRSSKKREMKASGFSHPLLLFV